MKKTLGLFLVTILLTTPVHAAVVNEVATMGSASDLASTVSPRQGVLWAFASGFEGHSFQPLTTLSLYDLVIKDTRWASFDVGAAPQEIGFAGASFNTAPVLERIPYVGTGLLAALDILPGDFISTDIGVGYVHSWQLQKSSWAAYAPVFKYEI